LDGEGHISGTQGRGDVRITQKDGLVLERAIHVLNTLGIKSTPPRPTGNYTAKEIRLSVDSPRSALEIIGRLQPVRLKENAKVLWQGRGMWGNRTRHEVAKVISVEYLDEGPVVALSTTTKTLLTEGLCSHNTNTYFTESLSFLPQSSAADIIFRAMIALMYERIGWSFQKVSQIVRIAEPLPKPARLHLSVHDSLLFGCPGEMVDEVVFILQRVMTQGWPELGGFAIPIDVKVSDSSWGECDKYSPILPVALAA
jgi:hypothetical protein